VIDENTWVGSLSVPYGVIRRLAYEQRRKERIPYLRILFGEAGRRGDPWGGLALEVNGKYFHFTAGVKRYPRFHDGVGKLTIEGQRALGSGVPGFLSTTCDWRWVQDEVDLTSKFTGAAIEQIAEYFCGIRNKEITVPMFQSRIWARRWVIGIQSHYYNCTTIILEQIRQASGLVVEESMPLLAFDALCELAGTSRSKLDDELNYFLSLPEEEINDSLQRKAWENLNRFAKGQTEFVDEYSTSWLSGLLSRTQ